MFIKCCRKLSDGLFLECCTEMSKLYPDIEFQSMIVDNTCMQVQFNLLLTIFIRNSIIVYINIRGILVLIVLLNGGVKSQVSVQSELKS